MKTRSPSGELCVGDDRRSSILLLVVRAGPLRVGLDAKDVCEVLRAVPVAAPFPGDSPIVGLTRLRDETTIVLDLNRLLRLPAVVPTPTNRMVRLQQIEQPSCLLVESVVGLTEIEDSELASEPVGLSADLPSVGRWIAQGESLIALLCLNEVDSLVRSEPVQTSGIDQQ